MALPICRWLNWLIVVVVSGTKMKLMAMPFITVGKMTLAWLTCRLMSLNKNAEYASNEKPKHNSQRDGTRPTSSRPTMNVVMNAATPRGLIV